MAKIVEVAILNWERGIWIVVSVRLWFGLVVIVFGVSGASDCDERVSGLRVMI